MCQGLTARECVTKGAYDNEIDGLKWSEGPQRIKA
jgi:hypothetical protein